MSYNVIEKSSYKKYISFWNIKIFDSEILDLEKLNESNYLILYKHIGFLKIFNYVYIYTEMDQDLKNLYYAIHKFIFKKKLVAIYLDK